MATIVKGTVESLGIGQVSGTDYDVYLDNGAPSVGGTVLPTRFAKLSYRSETEEVDAHLLTSKLTVTFSVRNDTELALFDGLIDAKELIYKLRLERNGSLYWVGFVLLDLVTTDFAAYPYDVKLTATDGISRLKSIDYEQGALLEQDTLKAHIFNVFTQMPLGDYYGAADEFLRVQSTLVPEGMTPGVNVYDKIRLSIKALRTVDRRGEVKYLSYYEALREFLKAMNARMMFTQGRYLIVEIANYARPLGGSTFYRYSQTGAVLASEAIANYNALISQIGPSLATDDAVALARGSVTQYPPLKAVEYVYKHFSRQNLFPAYNNRTLQTATSYQEIENFGTNGGAGTLSISGNVSGAYTSQAVIIPENTSVFVRLAISLVIVDEDNNTVGDSLKRAVTIVSNGFTYRPAEWVASSIGQLAYFILPLPPRNVTNSGTAGFTLNTPPVPREGKLRFSIIHQGVFANEVEYDPATVIVRLQDFFMESILTGSIEDQYNYTDYTVETAAAGFNSVVLEREILFGDGPGENTFGRIEYTEDGTEWLVTDGWRRWSGAYINATAMQHTNLIAALTLALQDTRRRVLDITVIANDYHPEFLLGSQSALYLMQDGELDLQRDEWRGRWFEIAANFVDSVTPPIQSESNPIDGQVGAGTPPDLPPPGGTGGGGGGGVAPPPPGNSAPGINTIATVTDGDIEDGGNIGGLQVGNLGNITYFTGDGIILTNPTTGQTQEFEVLYDSDLGVPDPNQITPGGTSIPYYGPDGLVWLIPDTGEVAVVPTTATADFPTGSYIQPDPVFTAQLQELMRTDHYDFHLFGYTETVTTGFVGPFWRAGNRIGWSIRKVHFALGTNVAAATIKINLKYYDVTGFRYTVATYNAAGDGGIINAFADVAAGYYRVEVETITGTAPEGLTVSIELIKKN